MIPSTVWTTTSLCVRTPDFRPVLFYYAIRTGRDDTEMPRSDAPHCAKLRGHQLLPNRRDSNYVAVARPPSCLLRSNLSPRLLRTVNTRNRQETGTRSWTFKNSVVESSSWDRVTKGHGIQEYSQTTLPCPPSPEDVVHEYRLPLHPDRVDHGITHEGC